MKRFIFWSELLEFFSVARRKQQKTVERMSSRKKCIEISEVNLKSEDEEERLKDDLDLSSQDNFWATKQQQQQQQQYFGIPVC